MGEPPAALLLRDKVRVVPGPPHLPVVKRRYAGLLAPVGVSYPQWACPAHSGRVLLTVGVQEREHLSLRHAGPQQPCCDEPFPLLLSDHSHDLQLLNIPLQPLLQVLWKGHRPALPAPQ